jgi:O-6-methylguanine DNA methyltransferase
MSKGITEHATFKTPAGELAVECLLFLDGSWRLTKSRFLDTSSSLRKDIPDSCTPFDSTWKQIVHDGLNSFFSGEPAPLELMPMVHSEQTSFQLKVLSALKKIPFGQTFSYALIAKEIGLPKSFRAVALACKHNPLQLFIPCHRVIKSDGSIGGFEAGVSIKRKLLAIESNYNNEH